jgi:hypothetical protein
MPVCTGMTVQKFSQKFFNQSFHHDVGVLMVTNSSAAVG